MFCSSTVIGNSWVICFGLVPRYATTLLSSTEKFRIFSAGSLRRYRAGPNCTHVCFIIPLMCWHLWTGWGGSVCKTHGLHAFRLGVIKIHQTSEKHMAWTYTCKQGVRFGSQAVFARACFFRAGEEVLQAQNWRIGRGLHSDLPPSVRFENIVALLLPGPSPFIIHVLFVYLDDQCW